VTVTSAPAATLPDGSVTVPVTSPKFCAHSGSTQPSSTVDTLLKVNIGPPKRWNTRSLSGTLSPCQWNSRLSRKTLFRRGLDRPLGCALPADRVRFQGIYAARSLPVVFHSSIPVARQGRYIGRIIVLRRLHDRLAGARLTKCQRSEGCRRRRHVCQDG